MATVTPTVLDVSGDGSVILYTWVLTAADDGAPVVEPELSDCCFHIAGIFGGGTATFEGSNTGADYGPLNDVQGNQIIVTAGPTVRQIVETPLYRRPRTSGGGGTTSLVCTLMARRQNPMRT